VAYSVNATNAKADTQTPVIARITTAAISLL
jgi:hypothetical protein